ncbi:MAG: TonB-dependent receptor, partial [Bacteroidota bacterium]
NTRQRGELGEPSLSDRDFNNVVNRTNIRWQLAQNDELLLSNLIAHQTTTGRDAVRPEENDPLTREQYLTKNILGLQYQRKSFGQCLTTALAVKYYLYDLKGVEARSLTDVATADSALGYYASAKFDFTKQLFVRASYESALRVPTFTQFFGNGANILSNVELKAESSDNVNVGLSYNSKGRAGLQYGCSANGFLRAQNDIIYLTNDLFQQYKNAEEVRTLGIEADAFVQWKSLRFQYNITRLQQTYESIAATNTSAQFLVGTPFPNNPTFFTNARLSYAFERVLQASNDLNLYVQYKYVDEFNFINVGAIYDPANFVPVQHRVDVGFNYTILENSVALAFNANNIFDAAIFDNFSIPRPGRNFNFKITYKFSDF